MHSFDFVLNNATIDANDYNSTFSIAPIKPIRANSNIVNYNICPSNKARLRISAPFKEMHNGRNSKRSCNILFDTFSNTTRPSLRSMSRSTFLVGVYNRRWLSFESMKRILIIRHDTIENLKKIWIKSVKNNVENLFSDKKLKGPFAHIRTTTVYRISFPVQAFWMGSTPIITLSFYWQMQFSESHGIRSSEYDEWMLVKIRFLIKKAVTNIARWGCALSWNEHFYTDATKILTLIKQ